MAARKMQRVGVKLAGGSSGLEPEAQGYVGLLAVTTASFSEPLPPALLRLAGSWTRVTSRGFILDSFRVFLARQVVGLLVKPLV